jgi:hypothetical protein
MRALTLTLSLLLSLAAPAAAEPSLLTPERAIAFLDVPPAKEPNTLVTKWNRVPTIFVDYTDTSEDLDIQVLKAVSLDTQQRLVAHDITIAYPNGGPPQIAAIGFANADRDPADELIVLIRIDQKHYDYSGHFVEIQIIDDVTPNKAQADLLPKLSEHFGLGCVCSFRDGRRESYKFDSIAAIKRELKRLGY